MILVLFIWSNQKVHHSLALTHAPLTYPCYTKFANSFIQRNLIHRSHSRHASLDIGTCIYFYLHTGVDITEYHTHMVISLPYHKNTCFVIALFLSTDTCKRSKSKTHTRSQPWDSMLALLSTLFFRYGVLRITLWYYISFTCIVLLISHAHMWY